MSDRMKVCEKLMAHIDAMLPASEPLTYHQRRLVREALLRATR